MINFNSSYTTIKKNYIINKLTYQLNIRRYKVKVFYRIKY